MENNRNGEVREGKHYNFGGGSGVGGGRGKTIERWRWWENKGNVVVVDEDTGKQ